MMVLVDTSVWIDHFKNNNERLVALLLNDRVLSHPMVLLELACGTPPAPRAQTLADIELLEFAHQVTLPEVRDFIEREKLYGLGCGLVDMVLLTSTLLNSDTKLWTLDKHLADLAERFGINFIQ